MRILFAILILAVVALLLALAAIVQHIRRSRRRSRRFREENADLAVPTGVLGLTPPVMDGSGQEVSFTEVSPFRTVAISRKRTAAAPPPLPAPPLATMQTALNSGRFPSTASAFDPEVLTMVSALGAAKRGAEAAPAAEVIAVEPVAAAPVKLPRAEPVAEPLVAFSESRAFSDGKASSEGETKRAEIAAEVKEEAVAEADSPEPEASAVAAAIIAVEAEAVAAIEETAAEEGCGHGEAVEGSAAEVASAAEQDLAQAEIEVEPEAVAASPVGEAPTTVAEAISLAQELRDAETVEAAPVEQEEIAETTAIGTNHAPSVEADGVERRPEERAAVAEKIPEAASEPAAPAVRRSDSGALHVTTFASLAAVAARAAVNAPQIPTAPRLSRNNSGKHPLASLVPPMERPDWAYFNKDMGDLSDPIPSRNRARELKAQRNLQALKERHKQV